MKKADIAVIGLGIMGKNLILNLTDRNISVAFYNRTKEKSENFFNENMNNKKIFKSYSIQNLIAQLKTPRYILLMVKSGSIIDAYINKILPYLDKKDVIIDGGNSFFKDTRKRMIQLEQQGIFYLGLGISGGEKGARLGASIMVGGSKECWKPKIREILNKISAVNSSGNSCCEWMGEGGAGHFVKMVHNGIEYAIMQLISETYYFMKNLIGMDNEKLSSIFFEWNKGELNSYLIKITSEILKKKQKTKYFIDKISDVAEQKGTGKMAAISSLKLDVPFNIATESVFARFTSTQEKEREISTLNYKEKNFLIDKNQNLLEDLKQSLIFSKIISYSQGLTLLKKASKKYNWQLNYKKISSIWQSGCIIESSLMKKIEIAFKKNASLENILFDKELQNLVKKSSKSARNIASIAILNGLGTPSLCSAINFFDFFTAKKLPTNLIQAQRYYFGKHECRFNS